MSVAVAVPEPCTFWVWTLYLYAVQVTHTILLMSPMQTQSFATLWSSYAVAHFEWSSVDLKRISSAFKVTDETFSTLQQYNMHIC